MGRKRASNGPSAWFCLLSTLACLGTQPNVPVVEYITTPSRYIKRSELPALRYCGIGRQINGLSAADSIAFCDASACGHRAVDGTQETSIVQHETFITSNPQ